MVFGRFFRRFTSFRVAIFADFIDPFCYIGFHELRKAAGAVHAELQWKGFELNPATPPEGLPLATAGNSDLRTGMWASVADYARRAGLDFPPPSHVPNTRLAQLLAAAPMKTDVKIPLIGRIYQAYFNGQKDIGDQNVLIALANEFEISAEAVRQAWRSAHGLRVLEAHRQEAQERQFPGMPGFVAEGRTHFGALSQDAWRRILNHEEESSCTTR